MTRWQGFKFWLRTHGVDTLDAALIVLVVICLLFMIGTLVSCKAKAHVEVPALPPDWVETSPDAGSVDVYYRFVDEPEDNSLDRWLRTTRGRNWGGTM